MSRTSTIHRTTKETDIKLSLNIDGQGLVEVHSGFGLLDHMLTLTAFWANFDLSIHCVGDTHIDAHHTVEDIGLVFGKALLECLGDKAGIERVGHGRVTMDEALAEVTIDISGRPYLVWRGDELLPPVMGGEEKDLWREYYKAFSSAAAMNAHIDFLYGKNGHHLLESVAKGMGMALKNAVSQSSTKVRSTKGSLD